MTKTFIKNRKNQKLAVVIEKAKDQKGLAFVMHGLGGHKEQPAIRTFAEAFLDKNYSVVTFDTTNTFGESDGRYEDATTTNYYEDLEDVIEWASSKDFYKEPFVLTGHSLGGICIGLFAENYPEKVLALAPIATVVSGKLSAETGETKKWKETMWRIKKSLSTGQTAKLPWSHMEDRLKYDLLSKVKNLKMPVLLVVGDEDVRTPLSHHKILFSALSGEKELHIIKGADHYLKNPSHLKIIKIIFLKWIDKIFILK